MSSCRVPYTILRRFSNDLLAEVDAKCLGAGVAKMEGVDARGSDEEGGGQGEGRLLFVPFAEKSDKEAERGLQGGPGGVVRGCVEFYY